MKKIRFFATTAMCAVALTASYFGYSSYQESNMTDKERMFQANLEALTTPEYPKNTDNIWNVTKEAVGGTDTYLKIICNTGGKYACPSII